MGELSPSDARAVDADSIIVDDLCLTFRVLGSFGAAAGVERRPPPVKPCAVGFAASEIRTLGAFIEEIRGGGLRRVGLFRGVSADVGAGILLLSEGEDEDTPIARIVGIESELKDAECLGFEEFDA